MAHRSFRIQEAFPSVVLPAIAVTWVAVLALVLAVGALVLILQAVRTGRSRGGPRHPRRKELSHPPPAWGR